jgi:hypothetical protein
VHGLAKAYARTGRCVLTPWISFPCSTVAARWRYLDDGKIEVEGMGTPTRPWRPAVNKWTALLNTYADRYGLPRPWVAAIARGEGYSDPKACSPCKSCSLEKRGACCHQHLLHPKGCTDCCAYGLMQLIRPTAVSQAKVLGLPSDFDIWDPETNIALGVSYLRGQVDQYKDFVHAATAYNAGSIKCTSTTASYWGVLTDGSAYPLLAIQDCNAAIDNGFPLSGPLPDMDHLPPVPLPHKTVVRELPTFGAIFVTALGAYAGYWLTQQSLHPRSTARRGYRTLKRAFT